jgi:hypothetical protein
MHLGRFTLAAVVLMIAMGWFVFSFISQESMALSIFGINLPPLPIAALVMVPVVIFYLAALFHMMFYSIKGYFRLRAYEKDFVKLQDVIDRAMLNERKNVEFVTERYKLMGEILQKSTLTVDKSAVLKKSEALQSTLEMMQKIDNAEEVNIKTLKLPSDNIWVEKDAKNQLNLKPAKAKEYLTQANVHSDSLRKYAYNILCQHGDLKDIITFRQWMEANSLTHLLSRFDIEASVLGEHMDDVVDLAVEASLTEGEYISLAAKLVSTMKPESRLSFFGKLSQKDDTAEAAYLYTLFDLEMISEATEILESSAEDEHQKFRAYLSLKESGQHFSLDTIVR